MGRHSVGGVGGWRTFQAKAESLIIGDVAHKGIKGDKLIKEGRCQNTEDFECQRYFLLKYPSLLASQKPQAAEYFRITWFTHSCIL